MRNRPCIALLSNYPLPGTPFTGGVETATAALLEGLEPYGQEFEFHLVSFSRSISSDVAIERDPFHFHFLAVPQHPLLRPHLPYNVHRAYRKLRQLQPDLIHCQDNMALALASIFSRFPRIFTVHGVKQHEAARWEGQEYWSHQVDGWIERYVHRHFPSFICISSYTARFLNGSGPTFAIPNAVRSVFFAETPFPASDRSPYFLFVGALVPLKRPLDLIKAHAQIRSQYPELKALFCGEPQDPAYFRILQRYIEEQQVGGVEFMGNVDQELLRNLIKGAIALVLPSIQENLPMCIAEAMAAGIPVVASRVGGVPDLVEHGKTGLIFEPGNVPELASHLRQFLEDPSFRERLRQEARSKASSLFRPEQVAAATVRVYRHLLQQGSFSLR